MPTLSGLEPLDLPSEHPRPATPSQRGDSFPFPFGPELLGRLEDLCRGEQVSLQMGLLALVGLLRHRSCAALPGGRAAVAEASRAPL